MTQITSTSAAAAPRPRPIALALVLFGCVSTPPVKSLPAASAQATTGAPRVETCGEKLERLALPVADGRPRTLYSRGREKRVVELQPLVRAAQGYLGAALEVEVDLTLAILSRVDWERLGGDAPPYGVPFSDEGCVIVAADFDESNVLAKAFAKVPPARRAKLERPDRSADAALRRGADLIAFHEAGHVFAHAYGIPMSQSWLAEFVASYLAYDTLRAISPEDAALWQEGAEASRAEPIPTHVSLEDFNRLYFGVGPDNYGWYQGRFQERVAQVQAKSGLGFIRALKSSGAASERDFAQQLQKLETLEPGFEAWAASLIALRPAASPR